jgi:hypothetical protein
MQKLQYFALVLLISGSIFSCKKDSGTSAPSNTDLLTKASWKIVNAEADTLGTGVYFSLLPYLDNCEKDDITTYKADHTYQITEGASKCNSTDPDIYDSGNWQFSADEKLLIQQGSSSTGTYTIESLTDATLIVSEKSSGIGIRFTYGH